MEDAELLAAADRAVAVCTCGAAAGRCPRCRGTGWEPGTPPRTACTGCQGLGGERAHDWECEGLHVPLIEPVPSPTPPSSPPP